MIRLDPSHFARNEVAEYDPLFGDAQPTKTDTIRDQTEQAYMVFAHGPGRVVLEDLIARYIAAPIFDSARDAAKGYERNGEANVVRDIMRRINGLIEAQQRRA